MASSPGTVSHTLRNSAAFQKAKQELQRLVSEASSEIDGIRGPISDSIKKRYQEVIQDFNKQRGRDLYFPFVSSGLGKGPFVELNDGSVKYDMITGIGVNFFGHTHPAFVEEMIDSITSDPMQGNLQPGWEAQEFLNSILSKVGNGCRLAHGWMTCSGTMANEVALKIIRQKKAPATKIFAFKDGFSGRSTAMQEITDNPKYREGQPIYQEVFHLSFFDPALGVGKSVERTLSEMKAEIGRHPKQYAAMTMELVQGEGGFRFAPREYYQAVFEEAKKQSLAIWIDEVQTFGRTGDLFAYQKFELNSYVDVVTAGKMLQACVALYTTEFNPKPGLIAGTFTGSSTTLRIAKKTLDLLLQDGFLGKSGKIEKLTAHFENKLKSLLSGSCKGFISDLRILGGMIAFQPFNGTVDEVKSTLMKLFDNGVIAFNCGHGPYLIRLLPPMGAISEKEIDDVVRIIEKSILESIKK
jgi:4-aminobutyrate aminotransferase-like enzyme